MIIFSSGRFLDGNILRDCQPCTSMSEAIEQLRADMRIQHWCLSTGLQVRAVSDGEGEPLVEYEFVVHVEPEFVGPRRNGVPRLMRVSEFAELMGWVDGPGNSAIFNKRLTRNKFKNRRRR